MLYAFGQTGNHCGRVRGPSHANYFAPDKIRIGRIRGRLSQYGAPKGGRIIRVATLFGSKPEEVTRLDILPIKRHRTFEQFLCFGTYVSVGGRHEGLAQARQPIGCFATQRQRSTARLAASSSAA